MNKKSIQLCFALLLAIGFFLIVAQDTVSAAPWPNQQRMEQQASGPSTVPVQVVQVPTTVLPYSYSYYGTPVIARPAYVAPSYYVAPARRYVAPALNQRIGDAIFTKSADGKMTWNGCTPLCAPRVTITSVATCNPCVRPAVRRTCTTGCAPAFCRPTCVSCGPCSYGFRVIP